MKIFMNFTQNTTQRSEKSCDIFYSLKNINKEEERVRR
jgi:hypothetical protein